MGSRMIWKDRALICTDPDGRELLRMEESLREGVFRLRVSGEMDGRSETAFIDELLAAASVCRELRLELGGLRALSPGGGEALLRVRRLLEPRGGRLRLTEVSPRLRRSWRQGDLLLYLEELEGEGRAMP